ncbi:hypothetical protein TKK_0017511 [Trichogramma kaykai]|uniref:Peptidase S1 domain-containing protein n=1 Tax=Trichogramma kaykai TaxID=54128 RepID=A0ABD2W334_9HYME
MLKRSLLGLFVGLILSISVRDVNTKIVQRIVGGNLAQQGRFKHQVSLQIISPYGCTHHFCGGAILDENYIITAAHCVTNNVTRKLDDASITVVAGSTDLRNKTTGIYRDVEYTIIPTSYTKNLLGQFNDDIALLRLRRPLPLNDERKIIRAVNLPTVNQYLPDYTDTRFATVSGFGSFSQSKNPENGKVKSGSSSPQLKYAAGWINQNDYPPCTDKQVCVRNFQSHGACHGDSGGPLTDESKNTLVGLVSYSSHEWCGDTTKYTRVSSYLDFINKVRAGGWFSSDDIIMNRKEQDFRHEQIIQRYPHCDQLSEY